MPTSSLKKKTSLSPKKQTSLRSKAAAERGENSSRRQNYILIGSVVLAALVIGFGSYYAMFAGDANGQRVQDVEFDGDQAYEYLKEICDIGPRRSGSEGMKKQQEYITNNFKEMGLEVIRQEFTVRHPVNGQPVEMANLIVELHPEKTDRVLLCCHYDTRPFPDRDPRNPTGTFIGANDGAGGVGLLMQMAKELQGEDLAFGVDLILFDGEELIFRPNVDKYFLGSEHFATEYANNPPEHKYHWGILVDMIAGKNLQLYHEGNSMSFPETNKLVRSIWRTAQQLRVREFINRGKHTVLDDHLALNNTAKIPTCDIIDFDFDYWHTEGDVAENCSAESMTKVGRVLKRWLLDATPDRLPGT